MGVRILTVSKYAVVRESDGLVTNVILYDPANEFDPGEGLYLVPDDGTAQTGGTWDGEHFLPPPEPEIPLDDLKTQKKAELTHTCHERIIAGFLSSALGEEYTYPSNETDQANLSASVLASLMPGLPDDWTTPFLCCDAEGLWAYHMHTAAQIQQVGQDAKTAILTLLLHKMTLHDAVDAATTADEVRAINWE